MPNCAIGLSNLAVSMHYLPTLQLNFSGGITNSYRIRDNQVEFQVNAGAWRILDGDEVQLHFLLHTEVSKWLLRFQTDTNPHRTDGVAKP